MKYVSALCSFVILFAFLPALFADEMPENVQVLTSLSRAELIRTMGFIRASLGVRCDYCHVSGGETGPWHFGSDDKDTKKTARKMMKMVIEINQQNFDGKPVVSCFTCHQGSVRPQSTIPVPFKSAAPSIVEPQTQPAEKPVLPTAASILDHYFKAIGSSGKMPLWHSLVLKGKREQEGNPPADVEIREKDPDHWLMVTTGPQGPMRLGTDGKTVWMQTKEDVHELNSAEALRFGETLRSMQLVPAMTQDYEVVHPIDVNGRKAIRLRHREEKETQTLFFDVESGLLLKWLVEHNSPVGAIPESYEYDDYKKVGSLLLPFTIRSSYVDQRSTNTRRLTEIKIDAPISDHDFAMPEQKTGTSGGVH